MERQERIVLRATCELFNGLARPTRLQILNFLPEGEMCVSQIEALMKKRQANISQQLMTLCKAGLVEISRDGLQVHYRLISPQIIDLLNLTLGTPRKTAV